MPANYLTESNQSRFRTLTKYRLVIDRSVIVLSRPKHAQTGIEFM